MNAEPSETQRLRTLGTLLNAPAEALLHYVYARLSRAGFDDVRPAHSAVLRNISRNGSRIIELSERARITKQSMAELVDHLRERGYVQLAPDPKDGRAKLVRLTEKGWKIHGALVRNSREFERECARAIGEEKWRTFRALLEELASWANSRKQSQTKSSPARVFPN